MAPKPKSADILEPDWKPTQAVDEPILGSPYKEPTRHWRYEGAVPSIWPGRRKAGYHFTTKKTGSAQQSLIPDESWTDLPLVNRLRTDVARWRESGYRGATRTTRDLLEHWKRDDRERPLFYCQVESIETLVYLLELAIPGKLSRTGFKNFEVDGPELHRLLNGLMPKFPEINEEDDFFPRLVDPSANDVEYPLALTRLGCKMATGSGKTLVMGMVCSWAFCNRGVEPEDERFPNGILICAPNLTVKSRLSVLAPDAWDNYYQKFDLVPSRYREHLAKGKVVITNWHGFNVEGIEKREAGVAYKVVNKGPISHEAFARDRVSDLEGRFPILVLNDEGHHCWRPKAVDKKTLADLDEADRELLEEEKDEATVWVEGLDRINNSRLAGERSSILAVVDMSATPFYIGGSGYPGGHPFPWLVSDFGLVDAIESGIVKIPRLPVDDGSGKKDDAGRPDPKYFRLWKHINDKITESDREAKGRIKPEAIWREAQSALMTLASQWKLRWEGIRDGSGQSNPIPPVMILVCDDTRTAEYFYEKISGERIEEITAPDPDDEDAEEDAEDAAPAKGKKPKLRTVYGTGEVFPDLFGNSEKIKHTVRIDSKLLAKIETEGENTKDKAARALREIIDSVGRRGGPGEHVRCVVSVSMLTEGWDASNVTHILGIRAFGSQLLCEQVVGRGLRRMNYTPDPVTGLLPAEYVDVYGIPFSLIPYKGQSESNPADDKVTHHIFSVQEKEKFALRWPVVESYTFQMTSPGLHCDLSEVDPILVKNEPIEVYLQEVRGYRTAEARPSEELFIKQDRAAYYESVRPQQLLFRITQLITDHLAAAEKTKSLARHQIFPDVLRIVTEYVNTKVRFAEGVDKRELGLQIYVDKVCHNVREAILAHAQTTGGGELRLLPVLNRFHPWESTNEVNFTTTRGVEPLGKSHLNQAPVLSTPERDAIRILEERPEVEAFTPNDRNIGLVIPYEFEGKTHKYYPDFLIRYAKPDAKAPDQFLLIEIKGLKGEVHGDSAERVVAKETAANKWVRAVNTTGRMGTWHYVICRNLSELPQMIAQHAPVGVGNLLPFQPMPPKERKHWDNCLPVVHSLKVAAGRWSEEQTSFADDPSWADDWIALPDFVRKPERGMFVAQIHGTSMDRIAPDGSWCVFRPLEQSGRGGSREGKRVLVWHSGVRDAETGSSYTFKEYHSEKSTNEDTFEHTRIVLKPLSTDDRHEPITLQPQDEGSVRVIAEFVGVVG